MGVLHKLCSLFVVLAAGVVPGGAQQPGVATAAGAASSSQASAPALPAGAEAPSAANTLIANARLVVLDLVVVDKGGNPVIGLTRDEFHVTEDGAPQTVRDFVPPGADLPPSTEAIDSTADLDRLAPRAPVKIVLLDEFNTRFDDMAFARYSLKKWLGRQPEMLDTPTMLVAVNLQHFTVVHDYTQSKAELLAALEHHLSHNPWQLQTASWAGERYATAFFTLRRLALATIGHRGHKNMIWIGRGFPNLNFPGSRPIRRIFFTAPCSSALMNYGTRG